MQRFKQKYERNGFIADDFVDGFNEELVYEYLAERFRDDLLIHVLDKDVVPEGFSRLGLLDVSEDLIVVGGDLVGEPKYEIKPDYFPIEKMFENFDRFESGDDRPYEYVPVANPVIPTNKLYDCDETKVVDTLMIMRGYKILDPTPGQTEMCDESNSVDYSDELKGMFFDRYNLKLRSKAAYNDGCVIVGLEFNPFNPRSAKMIQQLEWVSDEIVQGTYKYRDKIIAFKYDLKSNLFRYHSDIWMKKLGMSINVQYHYQSYDLVSVKRFMEGTHVPRDFGIGQKFMSVIVEPISTDRLPVLDYSIIGPWHGHITRGIVGDSFYSPYFTPKLQVNKLLTPQGFKVVQDHYLFPDHIFDKENGVRIKYVKGKLYSDEYFVRKTGSTTVLMKRDENGDRRMYECNFRIPTQFNNYSSSLIEHPVTTSVIDYICDVNKLARDQGMQGNDWGTVVDESYTNFGLQEVDEVKQVMPQAVQREFFRVVSVDPATSESMRNVKRILRREVQNVVEKTRDEKIASAVRDHDFGPPYKQKKFYKDYYSKERKYSLKNDFILGKYYLNSMDVPLPMDKEM